MSKRKKSDLKKNRRKKSGSSAKMLVISMTLILATLAISLFLIGKYTDFGQSISAVLGFSGEVSSSAVEEELPLEAPESSILEEEAPPAVVEFRRPTEMKAALITPGEDFLADPKASEASLKEEIDKIIEGVKALSLNTLAVDLHMGEKPIFTGSTADIPDFDILEYISTQAKAAGIYTYFIYDIYRGESSSPVNAQEMELLQSDLVWLTKVYEPDAVLFDNYDLALDKSYLAAYQQEGGGIGFENYLYQMAELLLKTATSTVKGVNLSVQTGLITSDVWANESKNTLGSKTEAEYQQYYDGYADTKKLIAGGLFDFVLVKNFNISSGEGAAFAAVTQWWSDNLPLDGEIPLYLMQASDGSFTKPDELAKQLLSAKAFPRYKGSFFSSYKGLIANTGGSTTALMKTFSGEISSEHIATELKINNLKSLDISTSEPGITIRGASDPNFPLSINGEDLAQDENGYFSYEAKLKPGSNKFSFTHKEKTVNVNITQLIQIIQSASPTGSVSAQGGTKMKISAIAYDGAKLTASLGGISISLEKDNSSDETLGKNSMYVQYVGEITIPAGGASVQELGAISVSGSWNGASETLKGASVKINKKIEAESPTQLAPGGNISGNIVSVVANFAETFPISTSDDYSSPSNYPLPKGAVDRIISEKLVYTEGDKTFEYYILASGNRVYANDISSTGETALPANKVSGLTIRAAAGYTDVILTLERKGSYKMSTSGGSISIAMADTSSVCDSLPTLSKNPLFSSATWNSNTLKLSMKASHRGVRPFYDGNNLVLRFNNPLSATAATVVIDPGHSDSDPGALGFFAGQDEREINRAISAFLVDILRAEGINVHLVPTPAGTTMSARVQYAINQNADVFVSVHNNSSPNSSATGTEAFYFNSFSKDLAAQISASAASGGGFNNRGAKQANYFVTRQQHFAAVLVECGFVSSQQEYQRLISSGVQESIAGGIASGIISYLNSSSAAGVTGEESAGALALPPASSEVAPSSSVVGEGSSASSDEESSEDNIILVLDSGSN